MLMTILNVVYVLIAIAMVALILMQRGAGAQAGSGFGAGASATVFGSRGAGNFLSKSTKWLAVTFFVISLFMGWNATHGRKQAQQPVAQDLGLMSSVPAAPATTKPASAIPVAPGAAVPTAPAAAAPTSAVPTAPAASSTTKPSQGN